MRMDPAGSDSTARSVHGSNVSLYVVGLETAGLD